MVRKNDAGTVDRVIALLRLIAESEGLVSIRMVSGALKLPPSTVHRLLDKLASQDLVIYERSIHRYRLGPELYRIGRVVVSQHSLDAMTHPILEEITQLTGETSILGLLLPNQHRMIFASKVDSAKQLRYRIELNKPITLVRGASGQAILAHLPEPDIEGCLAEEAKNCSASAPALTQLPKLKAVLAGIRKNGYATSHGSRISGAVGLAVPVFAAENEVFGSLCITIPEQRYDQRKRKTLVSILMDRGKTLSKLLGAQAGRSKHANSP